jgi:hypothetical protein
MDWVLVTLSLTKYRLFGNTSTTYLVEAGTPTICLVEVWEC